MNKENLILKNENNEIIVELKQVLNFTITLNKFFEVPILDKQYKIYPNNPKSAVKYKLFMDLIKEHSK